MVLPSLLKTLEEEESWRTKAGSVELLGAMAYCAPKQLSSCLPSIVPKLMDTLADSHSKVQVAGTQALKQIGSVIKNPQIQSLVPMLLEALSDPSNKANECLQELLNTEFIHVIDPPSLALIMPTLKRTLDLRSTDTKKMAAQIIGNMYVLTDKKDLTPYLAEVLPGLQKSLVDPVPEVRTVCAKALGAIVRGMGEEGMKDLLPWLLDTLKSDGTSVDRSGAAQGISEVLYARGVEELSKVMPHFLASSQDTTLPTHVRDGYLMLFVYLPLTFGEQLAEFIGDILTPVLKVGGLVQCGGPHACDDVFVCAREDVFVCAREDVFVCAREDVFVCAREDVFVCAREDVFVCAREDVFVCAREDVFVCACEDVFVCAHEDVFVCAREDVFVCACEDVFVCMRRCVCVCM